MQDIERGLSDLQVEESRLRYGANILTPPKKKGFFRRYISNFSDPIIRVLLIALFVNIVFMLPDINWFECGGIVVSVLVSTLVSTYSEYSNENAFERLRAQSESALTEVRRNGERRNIPSDEIVVGDIMILTPGVRIQADGEIIVGQISVDESMLTGESGEVRRDKENKKVLKGALVCSGAATVLVNAVGEGTYYGKTARELSTDTRPSPLKERLSALAKTISKIGYSCAILIALAYLFNVFFIDSGMRMSEVILKIKDIKFLISKLLTALTLAISVVVMAVPEGLPMMITVVLSSNMKRMLRDSVIVRKPVGIETSGNISLLFTDKTGTLTEGALKVGSLYTPWGESISSISEISNTEYKKYLTMCALYCGDIEINGSKVNASNPTDRAICRFVGKEREKCEKIRDNIFDSVKKHGSSVVKRGDKLLSLFKGAPEKIIAMSSNYMDADGKIIPFLSKERVYKRLKELTENTYRVVALAIKTGDDDSLNSLTFLGLIALRDRIRRQVPSAVKTVTGAGIGVIMITGDNRDTAEAIAKECGIISRQTGRSLVLTGEELSNLSDKEVGELLPTLAVVARVLPTDKSRLVAIAQGKGYVVGMTGDGINDASSLKRADVGFAMGSGSDVAKEAGDIVIADNNFGSICKAILYGRSIFESIRKFIVFQLTMNFGAMGISLVGPFIGVDNPVTVSQMLWVNIIMDTLGALAFASEPPFAEYMNDKPKERGESILNSQMLHKIGFNSVYILILCIWFLKSDTLCMIMHKCDERYILSGFFAMFCFMSIFVCFASRTDRLNILSGVSKNPSFVIIMLLIGLVQVGFIYFGGDAFRSVPLLIGDLMSVVLISSTTAVFDLIRKLLYKRRIKRKTYNIRRMAK
ncbi:MAG: calcium-translocating P-type ATPase, PMCA-type [Clostridia bacterium]|nr:calcium-translocating P-type ATPase, PMCA-type [Clostridia bacterium]